MKTITIDSILRLNESLSISFDKPSVLMTSIILLVHSSVERLTCPCVSELLRGNRENKTIERIIRVLVENDFLHRDCKYKKMQFLTLTDKSIGLLQ